MTLLKNLYFQVQTTSSFIVALCTVLEARKLHCIHRWSSEYVCRAGRICQGADSLGTMTTSPNLSPVSIDLNRLDSPRVQALAADVLFPASDALSLCHGFE